MSAAPTLTVRLHIVTPAGGRLPPVDLTVTPSTTLRDVLGLLARTDALPPGAGWTFRARDGTVLQPDDTLRDVAGRFGTTGAVLELILVPMPGPAAAGGAAPPPAPGSARSAEDGSDAFDLTLPSARPPARSVAWPAPPRRAEAEPPAARARGDGG